MESETNRTKYETEVQKKDPIHQLVVELAVYVFQDGVSNYVKSYYKMFAEQPQKPIVNTTK